MDKARILKLVSGLIFQVLFLGAMLFGPAGTFNWWQAWVFLGLMAWADVAISFQLLARDPDLLDERLKAPIQREQPGLDKVVITLFLVSYVAVNIFTPLDVFRFHLLPKPLPIVSWLGLAFLLAGGWVTYRALMENSYAAPVVKYQEERGQHVIDTGPYAQVRHPMYAGFIGFGFGLPLWLGSYAATIAAIIPFLLLATRILVEEQFLVRELEGYAEYMKRVRSRLIPGVW